MENLLVKNWSRIRLALGLTLITFLALDLITGHSENRNGQVVDKIFIPERHYVTTETHYIDGKPYQRLVNHYDPPSWKLVLKLSGGEIVKADCRAERYYQTSINQMVPFKTYYGGYTKIAWSRNAL